MDVTSDIVDKVTHQHHGQRAPDEIIANILATLNSLKNDSDDIVAAIVTSSDGLPWAQVLPDDFDVKRFSAMSSAILALSITMAREAGRGETKNLLVEADNGNIYVLQAGPTLLLTVFTKATTNMGLTLAHTRGAAELVEQIMINYGATQS
ncbi:MAG: roadblock/LC7 domain-containing protein [Gammaproteobacteria bacterium]|nr:roadblock/LC7 domain-containing protein [Gammaproteobacteria bacterium]